MKSSVISRQLSVRTAMELAVIPAKHSSFPRKRESTPWTFGNALPEDWIPAFAGMTGGRIRQ
jgi:hypothetical protein